MIVEVRAHGDAGANLDADSVAGDGVDGHAAAGLLRVRAIDDFRIDAGAHGFQDGLARALDCKVDGAGAVKIQRDAGFIRRDESQHDVGHVAARKKVGLQQVGLEGNACFDGCDPAVHDHSDWHPPQPHPDQLRKGNRSVGHFCPKPDAEKVDENEEENEPGKEHDAKDDGCDKRHGFIWC